MAEGFFFDDSYPARDRDGRKRSATIERALSDLCHAVGDGDGGEEEGIFGIELIR